MEKERDKGRSFPVIRYKYFTGTAEFEWWQDENPDYSIGEIRPLHDDRLRVVMVTYWLTPEKPEDPEEKKEE
jgi:hypothetical protein